MSRFFSWLAKILDSITAKMAAVGAALAAAGNIIYGAVSKMLVFLASIAARVNTTTTFVVEALDDFGTALPDSGGLKSLFYYMFDLVDLIDFSVAFLDFVILSIGFYVTVSLIVVSVYAASVVYSWLVKLLKLFSLSTIDAEG